MIRTEQFNTQEESVDYLRIYYKEYFPIKTFCKWLLYEEKTKNHFSNREFSFTLQGDIYCRYLSFNTEEEFKASLIQRIPIKIDIGAIYTANPRNRKMCVDSSFYPIERELVFDIDLTDYDDVRICCSKGEICRKCWLFVIVAIQIINEILQIDFGFKKIIWIYSGRRGVHCWVCDKRARRLDTKNRKAICSYIDVQKDLVGSRRTFIFGRKEHKTIIRAREIIKNSFEKIILKEQNILQTKQGQDYVLNLIEDIELKQKTILSWKEIKTIEETSIKHWSILEKLIEKDIQKNKKRSNNIDTLDRIMFKCLYPRIDANVTNQTNHLLKSPFSVHPKTESISIPLAMKELDQFDPSRAVSLKDLVENKPNSLSLFKKHVDCFNEFISQTE